MEPKLTVAYNSHGSNGILGVGWSLSGLSGISRCPRTSAQDGIDAAVNNDLNDRYCVDGARLVRVGTLTDGLDGSEYRIEIDSASRVVAYGSAGSAGPSYFVMKSKGGIITEYGNTTDSKLGSSSGGAVRSWFINKISDTYGNYISYTYNSNAATGESYISRIDYGGNVGAGLSHKNSVIFDYNSRPDLERTYLKGGVFHLGVRIASIRTQVDGVGVRRYNFSYSSSAATGRSLLTKISSCTAAGQCLPDVSFSWFNPSSSSLFSQIGSFQSQSYAVYKGDPSWYFTGDFNGDGKTDYLWCPDGGDGRWLIGYGSDAGITAPVYASPALPASLASGHSTRPESANWAIVGDFNGDGKSDYMWIPSNGDGRWLIAYGSTSGFVLPSYASPALPNTFGVQARPNRNSEYQWRMLGDFNGDGRADYMWIPDGTSDWVIAYGSSNGFVLPLNADGTLKVAIPNIIGGAYYNRGSTSAWMLGGDFNGDGKTDYMWLPQGSDGRWMVAYGTQDGFEIPAYSNPALPAYVGSPAVGTHHDDHGWRLTGDFNGDGRTDYMWLTNGTSNWVIAYGSKDGFIVPLNTDGSVKVVLPNLVDGVHNNRNANSSGWGIAGDFNGDSKTDYIWLPQNGDGRWMLALGRADGLELHSYDSPVLNNYFATGVLNRNAGGVAQYQRLLGDFDGDGKLDYAWLPDCTGMGDCNWRIASLNRDVPDRITYISDGGGSTVAINYQSLARAIGGSYTLSGSKTYPQVLFAGPMFVVSSATFSNGVGGTRSVSYKYANAVIERGTGRGASGFEWVQQRDDATGIVSRTYYRQDWPLFGMSYQSGRGTSEGNWSNLELTQTLYSFMALTAGDAAATCTDSAVGTMSPTCASSAIAAGKRYVVYPAQRDTQPMDLDGTALPRTRVINQNVDKYGNVGTVITQTLTPSGTSAEFTKTLTNTYGPADTTNWILGRLLTSKVEASMGTTVPASVVPGSGGLPAAPAPTLTAQQLVPILSVLLDD